jgi:cytochrome bd ubiquinol oxidase subunit I
VLDRAGHRPDPQRPRDAGEAGERRGVPMSTVDLSRFQFAMTSIYHFLFVPVTIGLAVLTAVLHTAWYLRRGEGYLRLTRFFGTLLVINIAVGVVTGLVQEFQFGMNWADYSRFVGDVFGAPLAIAGLAAFFLESTFLGLWLFGWGRLSPRVHLATVWMVALGALLSAAFIMAANSWMQHPVGYQLANGRAELTSFWAVLRNPVFLWAYTHVVLASLVTGATVMLAVSAWHLLRRSDAELFSRTAKLSLIVLIPGALVAMFVGSELGVVVTKYQPMKIAASEAQWQTCQPCSFSLFQVGGGNRDETPTKIIQIPHLLSLLATNSWNGQVQGLNELDTQYQQQYGPNDYVPNVFVQYWSMRGMAYTAGLLFLLSLWGGWLLRRKRILGSRWFNRLAIWAVLLPFVMNTAGWMLTENGRQPWIVQGLMRTSDGASASVGTATVVTSIVTFGLLYLILGVVAWTLMVRYARRPLGPAEPVPEPDERRPQVATY